MTETRTHTHPYESEHPRAENEAAPSTANAAAA